MLEENPLVSIIIPTLNEAEHIEGLLQELQVLSGVEIIVSDGGSTDDTLKICSRFSVNVCAGPAGRGAQLNRGSEAARADILLFLHADSNISAELIEQVIEAVGRGRLWGCARIAFDDPARFFMWLAFVSNLRACCFSSCYGDQAIFCHKDFFVKNGRFPETIFLEDLAFSHKARCRQRAFLAAATVISSSRRFQAGGPWRTVLKMQVIKLLYLMGVKPERLYRMYR